MFIPPQTAPRVTRIAFKRQAHGRLHQVLVKAPSQTVLHLAPVDAYTVATNVGDSAAIPINAHPLDLYYLRVLTQCNKVAPADLAVGLGALRCIVNQLSPARLLLVLISARSIASPREGLSRSGA